MQDVIQDLAFNLTGINILDTIRLLFESGLFVKAQPSSLEIDFETEPANADWLHQLKKTKKEAIINWDEGYRQEMRFYPGDAQQPDRIWVGLEKSIPLPNLLSTLETLPFALASFRTLYPEWEDIDPDYIAPSFGNGHYPHGWACAVKGAEGHEQFVSGRWLTSGPWESMEMKNDLTFILFHCLTADPKTALHQARPGHERIGITDEGGFLQTPYLFEYPIKGRYEPSTRLLKVIVHGASLQPLQLLDYSAARREQTLGADQPLERIAFIFMERSEAEKYVETLWLRNLECYAIDGGKEIRLDADFTPPPKRIPW